MKPRPYTLGCRQHDVLDTLRGPINTADELAVHLGWHNRDARQVLASLMVRGMVTRDPKPPAWPEQRRMGQAPFAYSLTLLGSRALFRKRVRGYSPGVVGTSQTPQTWPKQGGAR